MSEARGARRRSPTPPNAFAGGCMSVGLLAAGRDAGVPWPRSGYASTAPSALAACSSVSAELDA